MLDLSHAKEIGELWESIDSQAALPTPLAEFFGKKGLKPAEQHRAYERHYLRCQAVIRRGSENHAAYTKDCSRTGMGLVSPVQLFPREHIQLWMTHRSYTLEVIRCRRICAHSYECGTIFILK